MGDQIECRGLEAVCTLLKNCNYILYSTTIDPSMNFKERINAYEECLKLKAKELEDSEINQSITIAEACSVSHL